MAAQKINACRQAAGEIILNGFVNKQFKLFSMLGSYRSRMLYFIF